MSLEGENMNRDVKQNPSASNFSKYGYCFYDTVIHRLTDQPQMVPKSYNISCNFSQSKYSH